MLAWTIYLTFIGAVALLLLPISVRAVRFTALATALAGLLISVIEAILYHAIAFQEPMQIIVRKDWIPDLGIEYLLQYDGISLVLVLLNGIIAVSGILFSWNIRHREKEFFSLFLILIGAVYGVFLSFDAFLLLVFYEIAIIPKYFLIAIWGSTRKEYGAMKLVLYSMIGGGMILFGIVAAYAASGGQTFNLEVLAKFEYPLLFQMIMFPILFVGFAVLAGLWPFHSWAPTGHVAAPTGASMLLAGVIMKIGAYGALRVAMTFFPLGLDYWRGPLSVMALIGIVYGACNALVQKDFKFVIGYSSVNHMGFVLLGMLTLHEIGVSGAVLQMFSHGILSGLLFAVAGTMVYERTGTRELDHLSRMMLSRKIPFVAVIFTLTGFASMGLPGFSGFVAELQILIGVWSAFPWMAIVAAIGILIGVAYNLRTMQTVFFTEPSPDHVKEMPGSSVISLPEKLGACLLISVSLVVGLYPRILLDLIYPSLHTPMMKALIEGGGH
jgi:NADH-quinone oxidoreductase subunit M